MKRGTVARGVGLSAVPALAAALAAGVCSSAWAQYTTLSGYVGTSSPGTVHQQSYSDNPNAFLSGLVSQDAVGNEAAANGTLAAFEGRFRVSTHACSGGGPGFGGSASASAHCEVTQDYRVVSTTLPAGSPVMITINWAVSGQGTAAGSLTHYTSGAVGGVNGQVFITVGGVTIINVAGERRRHYNTDSGYYHFISGNLNVEEDHYEHHVTALVGQDIRIVMSGTATGNSAATLSSVTDGDSQLAMLWGITSENPSASVVSLTYPPGSPVPPPNRATPREADDYRDPRPPYLPDCFTFSTQPLALTACASTDAGFSVSVVGPGPFYYEWYRDGVPVDGDANHSATTATLLLPNVSAADAGLYTVEVTNPCGYVTSEPAVLTVIAPPTISTQPVSISTCESGTASFSVAVDAGAESPSYEWQVETAPDQWGALHSAEALVLPCGGSVAISQTNSASVDLTVTPCPGVTQYRVRAVITNTCGSVISDPATLTINSADFNGDGDLGTDADIEAFFACLGGSCCATCGSADFNGDGDLGTDADIEAFFRVLGGGAC